MARISVPCDDLLYARMQRYLPWGTQAAVMRRLLELLVDRLETEGISVVELLVSGKYDPIPREKRGKLT